MMPPKRTLPLSIASTLLLASAGFDAAHATEAVAGRYMPGALAGPGLGVVPPVPGLYWAASAVYYKGDAAGRVPFGTNEIALGLEGNTFVSALAGLYVPTQNPPGNWTYAFQAAVPVGWTAATADIGRFEVSQEAVGLGDIAFSPVLLGWRNEPADTFVSLSLTVTAPTGVWENGKIAFVGLNYWTFTPAIAFTRLVPEAGLDFSFNAGIDINTENRATDYYSGAVAHVDVSLTKNLTDQLAIGAIAGVLYQVQDDDSTFANTHGGFRGQSVAIGPLVKYKAKFGEGGEVDFGFKWSHELTVKNRMRGNAFALQVGGKF